MNFTDCPCSLCNSRATQTQTPQGKFVYQIRLVNEQNSIKVLCGVYSSVQSIINHFPFKGEILQSGEKFIIFKHFEQDKVDTFQVIKSEVM